mgnify:CR=1 FL=1
MEEYLNLFTGEEIKKLNDYLFKLTMSKNKVTKKEFEEFLCSIRDVPEIPNRQVTDIWEGYKKSDLYVDLINYILNSD